MTKIDKIHREITQRIELLKDGIAHPEVMKRVEGALQAYESILAFIDTLQEQEKELEGLDEAAEEYEKESLASKFPTRDPSLTKADIIYIFKAGAEWMLNKMK